METLLIESEAGFQRIVLNRPERRNAFNDQMLVELLEALNAAEADPEVRCIVLTGVGSVFCAGGDLKELVGDRGPLQIRSVLANLIKPVVQRMRTLDTPVITALNGAIAGGALPFALAADMVIASETARFVTAFAKIGAMPDAGTLYLLMQTLGPIRAKEILFRSRVLSAKEALDLGLYTTVVPAEVVGETADRWAAEIAAGPTTAFAMTKHAMRNAGHMSFDAYMELEGSSQALLHTSHDHAEGVRAFIDKRAPNFTGE